MKKINRIVLCREDYLSQDEFENEIKKAIMLLLNANYIMTIKYDDGKAAGIVCIDFNYDDVGFGDVYPYWLSPEEYQSVIWDDERKNE